MSALKGRNHVLAPTFHRTLLRNLSRAFSAAIEISYYQITLSPLLGL